MALEHRYLNIKRRATHRVEATFAYCNYMRVHGSFSTNGHKISASPARQG